jgi:hypothetical protein
VPETRVIEIYKYDKNSGPGERTLDKATITKTTYIVSDEELAEEKKAQRMAYILDEIDGLSRRIKILEDKNVV